MSIAASDQARHWKILGLVTVLAYGGLLLDHARRLWACDYFQFFPVFLVATIYLTADQIRNTALPVDRTWRIGPIAMGSATLALFASIWFGSPLLGAVSLVLLGDSLLCQIPGARRFWRLTVLLIPLPLGLDGQLIRHLQLSSSVRASQILDAVGVPHLMQGNVLELADRRLFVAEACSGISSIYLMLAATALYVVFSQMRLVRGIPLLLSVFWWAMVANAIRIVVIAVAQHFQSLDFSSGWLHETLGVALMLLAFLGIWSTRAMFEFLLNPIGDGRVLPETTSEFLTPIALWNVVTTSHRTNVYLNEEAPGGVRIPQPLLLTLLTIVLLSSAAVYWAVQLKGQWERWQPMDAVTPELNVGGIGFAKFDDLDPGLFEGLHSIRTDTFRRTVAAAQTAMVPGGRTKTWQLQSPVGPATVTLAGPFPAWQDAERPLQGEGWAVQKTTAHSVPGQPRGDRVVSVRLVNADGVHRHLHVCHFRTNGELLSVPLRKNSSSVTAEFRDRLQSFSDLDKTAEIWQIQMQVPAAGQSLDAEISRDQHLFHQLLTQVLTRWRSTPERTSAADTRAAATGQTFSERNGGNPGGGIAVRLSKDSEQ